MKGLLLVVAGLFAFVPFALAGGNTSIVNLDTVSSIVIEENRITIKGSGMLKVRILSDAEHGDGSVFGQPAQWLHAKVVDATFVVVPYFTDEKVDGVPTGGHSQAELKALSDKWWVGTLEDAKKVEVGKPLTIGYQQERMTIMGCRVTEIVGSGSLGF